MKVQTPFWPLLKNELAIGRCGGTGQGASVLLVYWLCVGALPLLVVFGDSNSRGNIAALFEAGFLPIIAFLFLSCLAVWITYATVPAFGDLLSPDGAVPGAVQHLGAFEFLFTRAVDRRKLFRARTTVFFIFALTPLFLNVLVSPFAPEIRFGPADSTSAEGVKRYEQYLKAFPESHPAMSDTAIVPGQIVIPHGAVAYTAWLAWSGTLAFLLLQGYGALIARRVKPNSWWTAFFPGALARWCGVW